MATYYVSRVDGNDSYNGTAPAYVSGTTGPWLTLAKAASTVTSGDTVYLRAGTWNEYLYIGYKTFTSYVTFKNYTGETPVLDGTGLTFDYSHMGMVAVDNSSYVRIEGLTFQNATVTVNGSVTWADSGFIPNIATTFKW